MKTTRLQQATHLLDFYRHLVERHPHFAAMYQIYLNIVLRESGLK